MPPRRPAVPPYRLEATRALRRRPLPALLIVAALALGSAAAITVLSLVSAVLLEPLPYPDSARLVRLHENHAEIPARRVSYPSFRDWEAMNRSFERMTTDREGRATFSAGERVVAVDARIVTAGYFDVLGLTPYLGRAFTVDEDRYGAPLAAVISHALWRSELGGSPAAIGTTIRIDGESHTVVGVAPPSPAAPGAPDVWVLAGQRAAPGSAWTQRDNRIAGYVLARLAPGVTLEQAKADMRRVGGELGREYPSSASHTIDVLPLREALYGDLRVPVLVGFAAAGMLLVIACVNASSLLLIRATSRSDAFALRAALGAARRDIALHVLAESLLFALAGTAIGVALAAVATKLLAAGLLEALPIGAAPSIDASAALFSVALMAALGVLTGLPPALRAASFRFGRGFGAGGRATTGGGRARDVLAVLQIALAMTLLVCAALLAESMSRLWRFDYGFDPSRVLTFRAVVEEARPSRDVNRIHARLLDALEALPGVSAAALTQELPGFDPRWQTDINPESELAANREPGELINVDWAMVSGRYFDALRIPIETGRAITEREAAEGAAVLVIDESLARRFWPDGDALGKPIRYDGPEPVRIVGIARNVRAFGREEPGRIKIYTPYGRFPLRDVAVIVRADGPESSALVPAIRAVLSSVDASLAIYDVATLEHKLEQHVMHRSLVTKLVVLFAALASVLAALGIHAVVSYAALQRSRELMIRVALGAHASRIVSLLLGKGLALAVVGVVLGLATAALLTRALSSLLFEISPARPAAYLVAAGVLASVALLGSAAPTRRVLKLDPALVMRSEGAS